MKVIKRDGRKVPFDRKKIEEAIVSAYAECYKAGGEIGRADARGISKDIERTLNAHTGLTQIGIEKIQDMVVGSLSIVNAKVAEAYERYRHERSLARESTIDKEIMELLGNESEYWKTENSNKNSTLVTTQRDYMAGIVSTDLAKKKIFPKDVIYAHEKGICHIHDLDYSAQPMTNCSLINLEDMLQNGTVVNGIMIEKPHRLLTAATIASQVILGVTSSQYGLK